MSEVTGVVVAHGAMADGLVSAVRRIAGTAADALHPVSNEGRGPAELQTAVREVGGEGPVVVFTDMNAGSCGMAALASCRGCTRRQAVISGVNLPILLDFVFHRTLPMDELVPRLLGKGREAIVQFSAPE